MSLEALSAPERARILSSAAALFALALVFGLIFTFEAIGQVAVWPMVRDTSNQDGQSRARAARYKSSSSR